MFDTELEKEIIKTRAVNKHKRKTPQSIRDYERIKQRVTEVGIKMDFVSAYLDSVFGSHVTALSLLTQAGILSEILGIEIDRLAKRNRSAMLCWYAENWELIQPLLPNKNDPRLFNFIQPKFVKKRNTNTIENVDITDIHALLNYH